ncbi:MAG TPA: ribosome maturation factor RimM [Synergistaceae bacterium]|nr:ribosome maturation factor RimM [Synergistaceae bacterium]HQK25544.1 ribosome maturation factor RimM [Synergistaceae bacterium]
MSLGRSGTPHLLPEASPEASEGWVTVGSILGAHGVRGAVRLLPLTDFPERFATMRELRLFRRDGAFVRTLAIKALRPHEGKGQLLVESPELVSADQADALKGLLVKVPRDELPELPDRTYWVDDLLKLSVRHAGTGQVLGAMTEVLRTGSADIYVFRTPEGKERMFPALKEMVLRVDLREGFIDVLPLEGLWEDGE